MKAEKMGELVRVRRLAEADLPALEWDGEYACYRKVYREVFRNMQRGITLPFVAETDSSGIIGQVILTHRLPNADFSPNNPYFFLSSFRVKPAFRDHGVGRMLLYRCFKAALDERITEIFLNCACDNTRAIAFYHKYGFLTLRKEVCRWSYVDQFGDVCSECQDAYLMKRFVGYETIWQR